MKKSEAPNRLWVPGLLLLAWAVALPVFFLDPTTRDHGRLPFWGWAAEALALMGGVLILNLRRKSPVRYPRYVRPLFLPFFVVPLMELVSYLLLFYCLPSARWTDALNTLDAGKNPPRYAPYLWANYVPNPESPEVNRWGWRYGGGPRRAAKRILVLGGSTVWSDGAKTPEASYPARLETALRSRGFDVEVINGGAADHTTAEMLGLFQFKGLAEKPDVVIFHVENDHGPLMSPKPYAADYSHWRTATRTLSNENQLFRHLWRVPSWTVRLGLFAFLRPDGRDRVALGDDLTTPQEMLLAETKIEARYPEGLERNLRSLVAMARAHGIVPVFTALPFRLGHPRSMLTLLKQPEAVTARAKQRWQQALDRDNEVLRKIAKETGTALLPLENLGLSDERYLDHCHLDEAGNEKMGEYAAAWLAENRFLSTGTVHVN